MALALATASDADHGNADLASPNMIHVDGHPFGGVNSDLAFWQNLAAAGNTNGFRLFDIAKPETAVPLTTISCRGPDGDVSFYKAKNRLLLFVSVDVPQTAPGPPPGGKNCASFDTVEAVGFEGIRIWDVTDPIAPRFVTSVRTDCGSHTHTTVPDYDNQRALIYVSSYPPAFATELGPNCGEPSAINGRPHGKISIVEVPDAAPEAAAVLKEQHLHFDTLPSAGQEASLGSVGCHDITVLFEANMAPEKQPEPRPAVAAASCFREGQLWDISDPANPRTLDPLGHTHVQNEAIELWHSSAFTWDGKVVLFGDEHGGGGAHGCNGETDTTGNIWFYENVPPGTVQPPLLGRYQLPRPQPVDELCSIHNFNIVPVNEDEFYIGVSSAFEGGTTVFDFTAAKTAEPFICPEPPVPDLCELLAPLIGREIAFFDSQGTDGHGHNDVWSSYWYNDFIYANGRRSKPGEPNRGFDVFKLLTAPAAQPCSPDHTCEGKQFTARKFHHANPQTQEPFQTVGN